MVAGYHQLHAVRAAIMQVVLASRVMEDLIAMAKRFKEKAARGANAGLNADELAFYDDLADNEQSVRELGDETLKKIAHELAESLRKNVTVA